MPEEFVVPEEERVAKAVHSDTYFDLIRRLSHQSVVKHFDAYADVDWDNPEYRIDHDDPRWELEPDDVLLACTDGLWGPLTDTEIAAELGTPGELRAKLQELGTRAVQRAGGASDNTSAAALRWLGD